MSVRERPRPAWLKLPTIAEVKARARTAASLETSSRLAAAAPSEPVRVFTDGSRRTDSPMRRRGPGGWAAMIVTPAGERRFIFGGEPETTSFEMELRAIVEALLAVEPGGVVHVHADVKDLVEALEAAARRRDPRAFDAWPDMGAAVARHRLVVFRWIKGHSGDERHNQVDVLAREAAARAAYGLTGAARG